MDPGNREPLSNTFSAPELAASKTNPGTSASTTQSDADLARAALRVLAKDPRHADTIRTLASNSTPRSFAVGETIALVTAALVVLQTRIKFARDKNGKTALLVEKNAASDSLLKSFVEKLLTFASKPPRQ